jgi:hypothetical protein
LKKKNICFNKKIQPNLKQKKNLSSPNFCRIYKKGFWIELLSQTKPDPTLFLAPFGSVLGLATNQVVKSNPTAFDREGRPPNCNF